MGNLADIEGKIQALVVRTDVNIHHEVKFRAKSSKSNSADEKKKHELIAQKLNEITYSRIVISTRSRAMEIQQMSKEIADVCAILSTHPQPASAPEYQILCSKADDLAALTQKMCTEIMKQNVTGEEMELVKDKVIKAEALNNDKDEKNAFQKFFARANKVIKAFNADDATAKALKAFGMVQTDVQHLLTIWRAINVQVTGLKGSDILKTASRVTAARFHSTRDEFDSLTRTIQTYVELIPSAA